MTTIKNYQIKPEIFDNPIFGFQLKGMRLFGFVIGTNQRYQLWHLLRCTFFTFSFKAFFTLNFIKVLRSIDNLEVDFLARSMTFVLFSTAVALVNAAIQRKRVIQLLNFVHEDLLTMRHCVDDVEEQLFNKTINYLRRLMLFFFIPSVTNGVLACLDSLYHSILHPELLFNTAQKLTVKPSLVHETYPFGEVYDSFIVGYLGPYYATQIGVYTLPLLHTFSTCLMQYMILKIEIVNKRLSEMDFSKINTSLNSRANIKQLEESEKNYWRLKMCEYCAQEQIKIRWFICELEQLLRIPVFVDFLIYSLMICVLLYRLTTENHRALDIFFLFNFIAVMSGYQFLYHWHATQLTKSHESMDFAIYSCDWYNYPYKVRKAILLIMMDSAKPLVMSAIIVELKLKTLLDIFRGALSYFSFLRNNS